MTMAHELFRPDNTSGYSDEELAALNAEWETIVSDRDLELFSDEYHAAAKDFCDTVARR